MAEARGVNWRTMRGIAIVLLLIKLVLLLGAHPFMDETYYFIWGQHPQLSYFDHPALIGWPQGIAGTVLGWNIVGLRAMVLLTLIGDLVLLYLFAQRTGDPQWSFWTTLTIFLATPILFGLTSVALPDHLMVFFTLAAVYCVERLRHEPDRVRWLYLGSIAAGFAMLSRYNSGVLAGALLAYILIVPEMRRLFATPHLYLAVLLALAMQTPVLIWNAQHGLASFGFITGGRAKLTGTATLGWFLRSRRSDFCWRLCSPTSSSTGTPSPTSRHCRFSRRTSAHVSCSGRRSSTASSRSAMLK